MKYSYWMITHLDMLFFSEHLSQLPHLHTAVPIQSDVAMAFLAVLSRVVGQVAWSQSEPSFLPVPSQLALLPQVALGAPGPVNHR